MSKTISTLKRLPSALTQLLDAGTTTGIPSSSAVPFGGSRPAQQPCTLYETLASLPNDGVGSRVHQSRWASKGIKGSFWYVTKSQMRVVKSPGEDIGTSTSAKKKEKKQEVEEDESEERRRLIHGKAWGWLVWRGKPISTREEPIPGGLKYKWTSGASPVSSSVKPGLGLVQPLPNDKEVVERIRALTAAELAAKEEEEAKNEGQKWTWKEKSAKKVEERRRIWDEAIKSAQ